MNSIKNYKEAKFLDWAEISGLVEIGEEFKRANYIPILDFKELVFTRINNPFQIPKYKVFEEAYFSVKGCPCSYPFHALAVIINFVSGMLGDFKLYFPKETSLMFVEAVDHRQNVLLFSIAPMMKSIYGDVLE